VTLHELPDTEPGQRGGPKLRRGIDQVASLPEERGASTEINDADRLDEAGSLLLRRLLSLFGIDLPCRRE
jgi:hypothetical protein